MCSYLNDVEQYFYPSNCHLESYAYKMDRSRRPYVVWKWKLPTEGVWGESTAYLGSHPKPLMNLSTYDVVNVSFVLFDFHGKGVSCVLDSRSGRGQCWVCSCVRGSNLNPNVDGLLSPDSRLMKRELWSLLLSTSEKRMGILSDILICPAYKLEISSAPTTCP